MRSQIFIMVTSFLLFMNIGFSQSFNENVVSSEKINEFNKKFILSDKSEYIPIIIEIKNFDKRNDVLLNLPPNKFRFKRFVYNGFSGFTSRDLLETLLENKEVSGIYYNFKVQPSLPESVPLIQATNIWSRSLNGTNFTGYGQTICIVDTGVNYSHTDLGGCFGTGCKIVSGYNTINENTNVNDTDGHGTHVTGIVSANGSLSGVAPNSTIVIMKGVGGNVDDAGEAIKWCIDNRNNFSISIISMSFSVKDFFDQEIIYNTSCDTADNVVKQANNATQFGILSISSAGNSGNKTGLTSPACGSNVTSIGATYDQNNLIGNWTTPNPDCIDNGTKTDQIGCGSNKGSILDMLAPGAIITSTGLNGGQSNYIGTSQAAPHVAGVAALMLQAANQSGKTLTPAQIEKIMKDTGKKIYDNATGLTFPRIHAYRAVLSILYNITVTDLQDIYSNETGTKIYEFSIYNSLNSTQNNINWSLDTGDSIVINSNQNLSLGNYSEAFVFVEYDYSVAGNKTIIGRANSTNGLANNETITVIADGPNLKMESLSILNSTGTQRILEFLINSTGTTNLTSIDWQFNVTGETTVNSTLLFNLTARNFTFVYIDYNYTTGGQHNITAKIDRNNAITELNETDNLLIVQDS